MTRLLFFLALLVVAHARERERGTNDDEESPRVKKALKELQKLEEDSAATVQTCKSFVVLTHLGSKEYLAPPGHCKAQDSNNPKD